MQLTGLIGRPVTHSWSQTLFNALYESEGIDAIYISIDLTEKNLGRFVKFSRKDFLGYNVTAPHKVSIRRFLDQEDPVSSRTGSVNLVKNNSGELKGFNTDYAGFMSSIKTNGVDFNGKRILIAGTGGTFRTVTDILIHDFSPSGISVQSRNPEKAAKNVPGYAKEFGNEIITAEEAEKRGAFDVFINCTPVGTFPDMEVSPFSDSVISEGATGIDMVYNPPETEFMKQIISRKGKAVGGRDLFISQAVESFRILFDRDIERGAFERALEGGQ